MIQKQNGWWVDENGNEWDVNFYTKEQAEINSKNLVNCRNCWNCWNCRNCRNCWNCRNCRNCGNCGDCQDCRNCRNCRNCQDCWNCQDCQDCGNCRDCRNCGDCRDCGDCQDCQNCRDCGDCRDCQDCQDCQIYISNPQVYRTEKIGSRNGQTTFYYGETKEGKVLQVICGCFLGNLEQFAEAVEKTHGDNEYGKQYQVEIAKVRALFDLQEDV